MDVLKELVLGSLALGLSLLGALALHAQARVGTQGEEFANGHWFDGHGFASGSWYVVAGRLTRQRPTQVNQRHDLAGGYVLPPPAEAHNHNLQNAWGVENFHPRYLQAGIQYAVMMCGSADSVAAARQALAGREGVDVLQASACVSSSDGHPLALARKAPDGSLIPAHELHDKSYIVVDSHEDIERKWPLVEASAPDLLKIVLVHSERPERRQDPRYYGMNGLRAELVAPLVARAHRAGLRVVAHVESAADFRVAVEAGVDLVGHLPGYQFWNGEEEQDYRLDEASLQLAAERRIPVITTAHAARMLAGDDEPALHAVQALQKQNLQRLRTAGVPLAIGSDHFTGTVLAEFDYLDGLAVMPREELLRRWLQDTPQLLFPARRIGRLEEGYEANFIVLPANPVQQPSAFAQPRLKVKAGRPY